MSIVGYILATRDITVTDERTVELTVPLAEGTGTYREDLTVSGDATTPGEAAVAAQHTLGSAELQNLRGVTVRGSRLDIEVTNVYNRANQRYTGGNINGRTGRVSDLTEDLFPIMPSAGLLIEF